MVRRWDPVARHRARLQHRLLDSDPETGIDRGLLRALPPGVARSGTVATGDGCVLDYKVFGHRGPVIVLLNGLGGTYRTYGGVIARLIGSYRLVVHDYRGMFESVGRPGPSVGTVAEHARDAIAVLDALGVERAIVFGWSMGVQVALEAWRACAARVDAFVFASGVSGHPLDSLRIVPGASRLAPRVTRLLRDHGDGVSALLASTIQAAPVVRAARALRLVGRHAEVTLAHGALLFSTDPAVYWRLVEELQAHDATDVLDTIAVPTLILAGDRDVLTPLRAARAMHRAIPGAELRVFEDCTHAVILEHPELVADAVHGFLCRRVPHAP